MEATLITVVMPAYNSVRTLRSAVESVVNQSDTNWELLILDDASTDGTWPLMQELAGLDARIRIVRLEENIGVGSTRNRGVELAKGMWIAFLDSDDLWMPDKLEKQRALLLKHPEAKLLYTGSGFISAAGERLSYVQHVPERINRKELLKQNLISCSSVLADRELLLRYPMRHGRKLHEDFVVWLQILEQESYAYGVDEPLLLYRRSEGSKSANKLRAAKMNWNAYAMAGLNVPQRMYYMCWYTVRGVKKYMKLSLAKGAVD